MRSEFLSAICPERKGWHVKASLDDSFVAQFRLSEARVRAENGLRENWRIGTGELSLRRRKRREAGRLRNTARFTDLKGATRLRRT